MVKFTLHNEHGDFMSETVKTFELAKTKCDKTSYKCKVFETYMTKSPWGPCEDKLVEHGKEVYRNF
jgi:hypothetical protein